jgi:hypothetical protein
MALGFSSGSFEFGEMKDVLTILRVISKELALALLWLALAPYRWVVRYYRSRRGIVVEEEVPTIHTEQLREIGLQFGAAVTSGNYSMAHSLLTESFRSEYPLEELAASYERMIGQYEGSPRGVCELMSTIENYQSKEAHHIGYAYVAICEGEMSEAVNILVVSEGGKFSVDHIRWGRP